MWPLILQHVREIAEAHVGNPESKLFKIITPFPPTGSDFQDVSANALEFNDLPSDAAGAAADTLKAYDFFKRTDPLYYDFSYGIRSEDYALSGVCKRFFEEAILDPADVGLESAFRAAGNTFLNRLKRTTVGALGDFPFVYTSLSSFSWQPVTLNAPEIQRLQIKAVAVYEDLGDIALARSVVKEIETTNFSAISYELAFFDVIREWLDPHLFHRQWRFGADDRVLYGKGDGFWDENRDVQLCYPMRFYCVRGARAVQTGEPVVRDHRSVERRLSADIARRGVRNTLLARMLTLQPPAPLPTHSIGPGPNPGPGRAGFVWVADANGIPGHWERARRSPRAGEASPPAPPDYATQRVAAVKCRILPREP